MKCPICDTRRRRNATHCPGCGASYATLDQLRLPSDDLPSPLLYIICWGTAMVVAFALLGYCVYLFLSFLLSPIGSPEPAQEPPLSAAHAAAEGFFTIESGAVTFRPDLWDEGPVLTIPDTVDGQTVTALGPGCFRDCTGLTTIILPETLTAFGPKSFSGCTGLRGLYLPQGMESIGENAFDGCIALEAICIPGTVTSIAEGVFDDCASLLYINYDGSFQSWSALYDDFITPFTAAICTDGTYYHGVPG